MRPGWQTSGSQLEAMVRAYATPDSNVLDLGCGRGGVVELIWRDVRLAAGLDPDSLSLTGHRAPGMPILRGVGEHLPVRHWVVRPRGVRLGCWSTLRNRSSCFEEVGRVLRPGGHFVFPDAESAQPAAGAGTRIGKALPPGANRARVEVLWGGGNQTPFPVQYTARTRSAGCGGWRRRVTSRWLSCAWYSDPTYLAVNAFMFATSVFARSG